MEYRCPRKTLFNVLQQKTGDREEQKNLLLRHLIRECGVENSPQNLRILQKKSVVFVVRYFGGYISALKQWKG